MKKRIGLGSLRLSLLQSGAAAIFISVAFLLTILVDETLLIASLGAGAFIAFAFPKAESARPRYLVGGYVCAAVSGTAFSYLRQLIDQPHNLAVVLYCLGVVFTVILAMTVLDFEHPPSVALAITLTLSDSPLSMAAAALAGILVLCACRALLLRVIGRLGLMKALEETIRKK